MKMKSKKVEQIAAKARHKAQLQKSSRRVAPNLERNAPSLVPKPTILIVCEGVNTEPSYFRQFRLSSATIKPIGEGYNTTSLVARAIELNNQNKFDEVWCVFDKDDFSAADFNAAIIMAEAAGFNVAYSNQSFEYWIVLHFDDHQGGKMHRKYYHSKISALLKPFGLNYDGKNKMITEKMFNLLDSVDEKTKRKRLDLAIERSKRNHEQLGHFSPADKESSTTVFKLVEKINKYR